MVHTMVNIPIEHLPTKELFIEQPLNNDWMLEARYPPFSDSKDKLMSLGLAPYGGRVWFGEQGNVRVDGPSAFFKTWTTAVGLVSLVGELVRSRFRGLICV